MKNERRNLLKSLAASGTLFTWANTPSSWSKPVVESVMLPAHAQTTSCGNDFRLNDLVLDCQDPEDSRVETFYIDETGNCPSIQPYPQAAGVEGFLVATTVFGGQGFELFVSLLKLTGDGSIDNTVGYHALLADINGCPSIDPVINEVEAVQFQIEGSGGGQFLVTAEANTDVATNTVSITNIRITRI